MVDGRMLAGAEAPDPGLKEALIFHPRLAPDQRGRPPKWAYIGRVKEAEPEFFSLGL